MGKKKKAEGNPTIEAARAHSVLDRLPIAERIEVFVQQLSDLTNEETREFARQMARASPTHAEWLVEFLAATPCGATQPGLAGRTGTCHKPAGHRDAHHFTREETVG